MASFRRLGGLDCANESSRTYWLVVPVIGAPTPFPTQAVSFLFHRFLSLECPRSLFGAWTGETFIYKIERTSVSGVCAAVCVALPLSGTQGHAAKQDPRVPHDLHSRVTEELLCELFVQCGPVLRAHIPQVRSLGSFGGALSTSLRNHSNTIYN